MARVVLFGGRGFIGSSLARGLDRDVIAPTREEVDLTSAEQVRSVLRPGDIVINATGYAAATDVSSSGLARLRRDNVDAVQALGEAASSAGVDRIIHLSSVAAMGHRTGTDLEESDLRPPRSPYGQSKLDGEMVLAEAAGGVSLTIVRPTSVFGEGRGLAALLCRIAALPVIPMPAGGRALMPFSYVGNLVAAVDLILDRPETAGRTFIVGDQSSYPLHSVLTTLARALGRSGERTAHVPLAAVRGLGRAETAISRRIGRAPLLDPIRIETLTSSISYSTAAFRADTGFVAPYSLDDSMARIAAWYRHRSA